MNTAKPILVKSYGTNKVITLKEMFAKGNTTRYRVGCDSANIRNKTVYITTIVGFHPGNRGAFIYYIKEYTSRIKDTAKRLWNEVEKSIFIANLIKERHNIEVEAIDFDLNTSEKYISSRFASSAVSYANSYGFDAYCKPDTLLSIYAADFISHSKSLKKEKHNAII
jgi:predicted RNase H-related nuclease YkuK (DUF458 family)